MQIKKAVMYGILVTGLAAGIGATARASGQGNEGNNQPPSDEAKAFAERTSDLMTNTVVAALLQEIGETTVDNVAEGNRSISLIFDDANKNMRLVGTFAPLSDNDYPQDDFEETALAEALAGNPYNDVDRVQGKWYYRRSIPLSNFKTQCGYCHANFVGLPSTEPVGALMLRIPITD